VDVSRIAEQEGAALAEMLGHPVMNMVGRKPVHLLDVDLEIRDRPVADVFELKRIGMIGALVAYGSDQARSALGSGSPIQLVNGGARWGSWPSNRDANASPS
jgi:hypothetical protein